MNTQKHENVIYNPRRHCMLVCLLSARALLAAAVGIAIQSRSTSMVVPQCTCISWVACRICGVRLANQRWCRLDGFREYELS